jgi:hypothetical protein
MTVDLPESPLAIDADPVLLPFLTAADDEDARAQLGHLLERQAAPVAWGVVRSQLRRTPPSDLEDVHAGVLLSLAAHLRRQREARGEGAPIRVLGDYVATIAHNACHAFHRARFPQRARLRSRVRYVLTRDPTLALWEGVRREWLCGTAPRRGADVHPGSAARLVANGREADATAPFPEFVQAMVRPLPGPVRFDDLVDAIATLLGVTDPQAHFGRLDEDEEAREIPDPAPSPEAALFERDFLARLWAEIRLLPARQRVALLLNLRDADGRGMIGLFPLTGTADLAALAAALDVTEERLRALWEDLPRDDAWIAEWLGVTRRQVINLRKCARERLARRMRRYE